MTLAMAKARLQLAAAEIAFHAKPGHGGELDKAFASYDAAVEELILAARKDELEKFRSIAERTGDAAGVGVDGEGGHA